MNKTVRISISLPAQLAALMRNAARREKSPLSVWVTDAAEKKLLLESARLAIASYEQEYGAITEEELEVVEGVWRG